MIWVVCLTNPGYQLVTDDEIRAKFEREYGVELSATPGRDNHQMIEGIHNGRSFTLFIW